MKNQKGFAVVVGVIALLILVTIFAAGGLYMLRFNQPTPTINPQPTRSTSVTPPEASTDYMTISGRVISVDLSAMQVDGDGLYEVIASDNTMYSVHLSSGESSCAIYEQGAPEATVGVLSQNSNVEVRGKSEGNILRVCDTGTYIKSL